MRAKGLSAGLIVAALGLAACGSSSSSSSNSSSASSSTSTQTSTTTSATKQQSKPRAIGRTYKVKLTGKAEVPTGAPKGTGTAVVSLKGKSNQVCFRFAHLGGFKQPTAAHIHQGAAGSSGNVIVPLSTGAKFLRKGCVAATPAVIKAIAANPHGYYLNVHSKTYPGGAVRSQL